MDLDLECCMKSLLLGFCILMALPVQPNAATTTGDDHGGYPTATRAEYVFACMATNGGTPDALRRCSCAIDVIASVLPFESYERAETVLRMRRSAGGYLGQEFRTGTSNTMLTGLEEAQAEAEVRCF
jgi:hypothetical protein